MASENMAQNTTSAGLTTLLVILSIIAIIAFIILFNLYKNKDKTTARKREEKINLSLSDLNAVMDMICKSSFVYQIKSDIIEFNNELSKMLGKTNNNQLISYNDFLEHISISDKEVFSKTITPIKNNIRQIDCLSLELINNNKILDVKCLLVCIKRDLLEKCEKIGGYIICDDFDSYDENSVREKNAFELMMQKQTGIGYWQYDNVTQKIYLSESAAKLYYNKNRIMNIDINAFMQILSAESVADLMIKISSPASTIASDYELLQTIILPNGKKKQFRVVCKSHYLDCNLTYISAMSFQIPLQNAHMSKKQLKNN